MIQASGFLAQSKYLLGIYGIKGNDEAYLRSAMSRAYYSLFHEAKAHLQSHYSREFNQEYARLSGNQTLSNGAANMHRVVSDTLYNLNKKNSKFLGQKFGGYRDIRNQADYELKGDFNYDLVNEKISGIESLIVEIKKL